MLEIHHVVVATRNPSGDDPLDRGDSEEGWYTVDAGLVTMVTVDGVPLRAANGERITARIVDGTAPRTVAARLVLSRWRNERDAGSDFNRPLHYSRPYGGY
jgi:hypothetical protein